MTHHIAFDHQQHHTEVEVREPVQQRQGWVIPVEIVDGHLVEFEAEMSVTKLSLQLTRAQAEQVINTLQAGLEGCPR